MFIKIIIIYIAKLEKSVYFGNVNKQGLTI